MSRARLTPVLSEYTDTCSVCGEVACERDLLWIDDGPEVICTECADGEEVAS